jgi:hypothetical protein
MIIEEDSDGHSAGGNNSIDIIREEFKDEQSANE